jgi:hypothetical protein
MEAQKAPSSQYFWKKEQVWLMVMLALSDTKIQDLLSMTVHLLA